MLRNVVIASALAIATTYFAVTYFYDAANLYGVSGVLTSKRFQSNSASLADVAPVVAALLKSSGAQVDNLQAGVLEVEQFEIILENGIPETVETFVSSQILAGAAASSEFWIKNLAAEAPLWAYSMLFDACRAGEDGLVASFIESGFDLTGGALYGDLYTDFMQVACRNGHLKVLKVLHENGGLAVDSISSLHGTTPLLEAVQAENMACLEYLLERGADPFLEDKKFNTNVIDWAARSGNGSIFDLLTQENTGLGMKTWYATKPKHDHIGPSTLGNAAMSGNLEITRRILEVYASQHHGPTSREDAQVSWENAAIRAFLATDSEPILSHLIDWLLPLMHSNTKTLDDADFDFLTAAAAHAARVKAPAVLEKILQTVLQPRHQRATRHDRQQILGYVLAALCETPSFIGDTAAILKLLLITYHADPNYLNPPQGDTALYRAVAHANHGELALDLEYGIHSRNVELPYPRFYEAIQSLSKITDPDLGAGRYANGPTPLWLAVWSNAYYTTMNLLEETPSFEYIDPDLDEDTEWIWITAAKTYRSPIKIYAGTYLSALSQQEKQQLRQDLEAQQARLLVIDRLQQPLNLAPQLNRVLTLHLRKTDEEMITDPRGLRMPSNEDTEDLSKTLQLGYRSKKTPTGPVASDFFQILYEGGLLHQCPN